jgi:3-oxoacyl-[acyl-carrier protein] reductase
MDLNLSGKTTLVTASSEGLGKHSALALAAEGADVAICARRPEVLEATRKEIEEIGNGRVLAIQADLSDGRDVERIISETVNAFGAITTLVNNMGISIRGDDDATWDAMYQLNLMSAVRMTRTALPYLQNAASQTGAESSSVIHIGSIYGRESGGSPQYNAMKAALHSYSKSLALELASKNIRVNTVAPGSIAWPGSRWQQRYDDNPELIKRTIVDEIAFGRFGRPEEIGSVVAFLASQKASWITGACINVDGGQSRSNL